MLEIPEAARNAALAAVGSALYLAASPDMVDGLSDAEFKVLKNLGVPYFDIMEKVAIRGPGIPEGYGLPTGFAKHYGEEVIPDLEKVRASPHAREAFRREVRAILGDQSKLDKLYRPGGTTFSEELRKALKSEQSSGFARTANQRRRV